ncbi:MAG TPA: phosphate ABC transporter substrate-binding protein PstS [Candidatus Sulfotelmatobacter sp.]|nr:phosphate ABC transporter substrate-binding protein PstS [Candidatus Sulfotelmatobacter sp.]
MTQAPIHAGYRLLMSTIVGLVLGAAALVACGCNTSPKVQASSNVEVPPAAVLLKGAGATFPSLLYKTWFASYQKTHPQMVIAYDAVGSGEGVRRFVGARIDPGEAVDFGASDAAISDEQIAQVPRGARLVPMTAGAVAIAYNLPNFEGDLKLSRSALAGIFQGDIKKWDDPVIAKANPGAHLPKLTIVTVVRQESSGTTYAFSKHLDAISESWRAHFGPATVINWPGNAIRAKGNEGVASTIEIAEGSIGYVGYEFAHELGLRTALLENKSGRFTAPSPESASAALASLQMPGNLRVFVPDPDGESSYPIVTMSWILLYDSYPDPKKAGLVKDLFAWCLAEGQNTASNLGYVPLPTSVSNKSLENLQGVH